jgi:hypothetical protein
MSLRQRRSDPFRTQSLPRNEREPSEENFVSDPRAHKRWQGKDASIRRASHSRRYNQSYGLSPNHLTERENLRRLNADIEILAKYLNLIARLPRAGQGQAVQNEDLACSRSGNLRILSVFSSSCSSPSGRHSGPWRKDGVSRGHLTNFAFARIDPPDRHRVSCPNSGHSSFRSAGQWAERVLY